MEIEIKNSQNKPEEENKFRGLMPGADESAPLCGDGDREVTLTWADGDRLRISFLWF